MVFLSPAEILDRQMAPDVDDVVRRFLASPQYRRLVSAQYRRLSS